MRVSRLSIGMLVAILAAVGGWVHAEEVAPGVTHTLYTLPGPMEVFVVAVDRTRPEYKLKVGWPEHKRNFATRQAVSTIAGLYDSPPGHDVLAAVNASFFDTAPTITGTAASDGEMLEIPSGRYDTFLFGPSGRPEIVEDIGHANGLVTFANGATAVLTGYNQPRGDEAAIAYTPQWAPTTGTTVDGVEIILKQVSYPMRSDKEISGVVTAVHSGPIFTNNPIPAGGMVLSVRGAAQATYLTNTNVGDRLRIRIDTTSGPYNNADMAITGIGYLVRNGAAYTSNWAQYASSFVDSRHPRTVLAWNQTWLYLIVIDGRSTESVGMSFSEMADFLINTLACDEAVNLDGGGSSTMWVDGTVRNNPSGGAERPVANAVLLVREDTATCFPVSDAFRPWTRVFGWDDKFTYNTVSYLTPAAPGGDGYVVTVADPTGGVETMRRGDLADTDYHVEADIYCDYRPDVASNGFERYGLFARDDGVGGFGLTSTTYGKGNCYALTYDSDTGRVRAGKFVNGVLTDFLAANPVLMASTAWRRFGIRCEGTTIQYFVDDVELASVTDTTFARGFFGIGYHEQFSNNANIRGTRADNFLATSIEPQAQRPYAGTPIELPGIIEAEHYDFGGEGVAYHDTTLGNAGNAAGELRGDDVDIEGCADTGGGYNVAYVITGEWLEYTVTVPEAVACDVRLRVAASAAGGTFHLELDGQDITGPRSVPATGGWQTWASVTVPGVSLPAGEAQVLRLTMDTGNWNVNSLEFVEASPPPESASNPNPPDGAIGVSTSAQLQWTAGSGADSHRVYFGTTSPGNYRGKQIPTTFNPAPLVPGQTYYWRIDEVNPDGTTIGAVWQFTTEPLPVASDFDVDGDVDLMDFGAFQYCFNGPNRPPRGLGCAVADLDEDGDVDLTDFQILQACFNGPNRYPRCEGPAGPSVPIPDRPAGAMTGSAFINTVLSMPLYTRESCILDECLAGNIPEFLRGFVPIQVMAWIGGAPHTATYYVMPDYLCIGSDADFVRMPMIPATAQAIADRFECVLPTRRMVDAIYAQAAVKLAPSPISPTTTDITAVSTFYQHHLTIEGQRAGNPLGLLVGGIKKDVVVTPLLLTVGNKVAIYGWHQLNGVPIQPLYTGHVNYYVDYSHGIRLVSAYMTVDGAPALVADVLGDPVLHELLSDEGVVVNPRY